MKKIGNKIPPILFLFMVSFLGFVIGVLTIALWQENWLIKDGILGQEFIYKIGDMNIDKRALFFLCLGKRIRAFFVLFLLAFSSVNVFANIAFFSLSGLYIGSVLEIFAIRYGMQGIFMYLTFILPQGIFYMIGFLILGCWCLKLEKVQGTVVERKKKKLKNAEGGKHLVYSLVFLFIGILLESYVNPKIFLIFI